MQLTFLIISILFSLSPLLTPVSGAAPQYDLVIYDDIGGFSREWLNTALESMEDVKEELYVRYMSVLCDF